MTAIIVLTAAALPTAQRIAAALPGASLHGLTGRVDGAAVTFSDTITHIRALFAAGTPIIGVCATGILIRAVAPLLNDKTTEPPVLAVAADGSTIIPLLGGHHGANALAQRLAQALNGTAAITTAGDLALGLALDEPPLGWTITNPQAAKPIAAALLAGESVRLQVDAGNADWLSSLPISHHAQTTIHITDRAGDESTFTLHPPVLALGVGCERNTPPEEVETLARQVLADSGLAPGAIACVVSIDLKADEAAVHALAKSLNVPARFFTAAELEAQAPRLVTPSDVVFQETGCHGVAEGAALAAAGAQAQLLVPKIKGQRTTIAIARSPALITPHTVGRARGCLHIVGIGPGALAWRTPEAGAAIAASTDLVGYGMYLDLLGDATTGKTRHESNLGAEADRARMALDLAAQGREVSLVCSGDAGIYALATLVFELMDREKRPEWLRLDVSVVPGVSALQAAAARAGAPINHDFCTISLSDLLTPWETIQHRLEAAAAADFVVCFYNPVSQRRRDQLSRARDILLIGRPPETPVILARQLGRPGETIQFITLGELTPDHADMLTMVVVGNSESRRFAAAGREWIYTPRGYAKKL